MLRENTVGESALRNFAGVIDAARRYVERSPKRIVLIDGEELARLMLGRGVGVRTRDSYEIKRIDEDYFSQEI